MARLNQYFPETIPHPGETLGEKLDELGMGPKEFAIRTGKPEKTITAVLKGDSSITPDMAVQFENVTHIPAVFWMNHQKTFDEYLARKRHIEMIKAATQWAKKFPISDLENFGWIPRCTTLTESTKELLAFFGFANHKAWEAYYVKQQLKVAFRISLASTCQPYAISAWLRMGEQQANHIRAKSYSEKKFKMVLSEVKSLKNCDQKKSFRQLQNLCAKAGVKVVQTPCLPNAPIHGSARWVQNTPLIQLSETYPTNNSFWFTFFHEAGHILKHGKKDIFLEDVEYSEKDIQKEKEADAFAEEWSN